MEEAGEKALTVQSCEAQRAARAASGRSRSEKGVIAATEPLERLAVLVEVERRSLIRVESIVKTTPILAAFETTSGAISARIFAPALERCLVSLRLSGSPSDCRCISAALLLQERKPVAMGLARKHAGDPIVVWVDAGGVERVECAAILVNLVIDFFYLSCTSLDAALLALAILAS
jgi:hypothetical protein